MSFWDGEKEGLDERGWAGAREAIGQCVLNRVSSVAAVRRQVSVGLGIAPVLCLLAMLAYHADRGPLGPAIGPPRHPLYRKTRVVLMLHTGLSQGTLKFTHNGTVGSLGAGVRLAVFPVGRSGSLHFQRLGTREDH